MFKRTTNGAATIFAYDGWKPLAEWAGDGTWLAFRIYGAGPDEVLWYYDSRIGSMRVPSDAHGNITSLLDWYGNGIERYTYDAFGQPTITDWYGNVRSQSAYGNRFLFQGREWIAELGIYDYRHRMYHPALGRFLQMDPMGLQTEGAKLTAEQKAIYGAGAPEAFASTELNLYRYCSDDPVDCSDPSGLLKFEFGNDSALEKDFNKARDYLSQDRGMREGFAKVEQSSFRAIIERTNGRNQTERHGDHTVVIKWNPRAGGFFPTTKGTQSPAMALGHEVAGHAERTVRDPGLKSVNLAEEMRVINTIETPAAKNLHEDTRVKYEGRPFPVDDVLSRRELR